MKQLTLLILLSTIIGCTVEIHESQLLSPSRASILPNDSLSFGILKGENIAVVSEPGVTLRGISLQNPSANKTIIYFYGNGGKLINKDIRTTLDSLAIKLDANFISFDYRGYGFSDGDASLSALLTDAFEALRYGKSSLEFEPAAVCVWKINWGRASNVCGERAKMRWDDTSISASVSIRSHSNLDRHDAVVRKYLRFAQAGQRSG